MDASNSPQSRHNSTVARYSDCESRRWVSLAQSFGPTRQGTYT